MAKRTFGEMKLDFGMFVRMKMPDLVRRKSAVAIFQFPAIDGNLRAGSGEIIFLKRKH